MIKKIVVLAVLIVLAALFAARVPPDDPGIQIRGAWFVTRNADIAVIDRWSQAMLDSANAAGIERVHPEMARTQAGVVISWRTKSPNVAALFSQRSGSEYRYMGYDVFCDGVWREYAAGDFRVPLVSPAGGEAHTWEIMLPFLWGIDFRGLELDSGHALEDCPSPETPVYVAIGNSITHGAYVVSPRNTYATHLARDKGWEVVNLAVGGSWITDAAVLPFEGRKVDVVTILWGYNDYAGGQDTSVSARAYHRLIGRIRRTHPSVPIYAITQTYTSTIGPNPSSGRTAEDYRRMVRTVVDSLKGTGDGNLHLLEGLRFSDASGMADYVHFNDAGAVRFADSLAKYMEDPPIPAVPRPTPASVGPVFRTGPNPASGNITLLLSLPAAISADLSIFDLHGRMVRAVSRGQLSAGNHRMTWNGRDGDGLPAAAGVYVCMLRSGKRTWLARTALIR